jgi:hypothetical protein
MSVEDHSIISKFIDNKEDEATYTASEDEFASSHEHQQSGKLRRVPTFPLEYLAIQSPTTPPLSLDPNLQHEDELSDHASCMFMPSINPGNHYTTSTASTTMTTSRDNNNEKRVVNLNQEMTGSQAMTEKKVAGAENEKSKQKHQDSEGINTTEVAVEVVTNKQNSQVLSVSSYYS